MVRRSLRHAKRDEGASRAPLADRPPSFSRPPRALRPASGPFSPASLDWPGRAGTRYPNSGSPDRVSSPSQMDRRLSTRAPVCDWLLYRSLGVVCAEPRRNRSPVVPSQKGVRFPRAVCVIGASTFTSSYHPHKRSREAEPTPNDISEPSRPALCYLCTTPGDASHWSCLASAKGNRSEPA